MFHFPNNTLEYSSLQFTFNAAFLSSIDLQLAEKSVHTYAIHFTDSLNASIKKAAKN